VDSLAVDKSNITNLRELHFEGCSPSGLAIAMKLLIAMGAIRAN